MGLKNIKKEIHDNTVINRFLEKGSENFTSLNGHDISYIFTLYDRYVFQSSLTKQLDLKGCKIRFYAKKRTEGSPGIVGRSGKCYYFEISPFLLNKVYNHDIFPDRVAVLQAIIENQIVHLMYLLFGFRVGDKEDSSIFQKIVMNKNYFVDHDISLSEINCSTSIQGLYKYWNNSCYLDSLLTVLLFGSSSFYRNGILDFNINDITYKKKGKFTPIGKENSSILTERKTVECATNLQKAIKADYFQLVNVRSNLRCTKIREYLQMFYPDMKPHGWDMYNVSAIYDLLTELFPNLKIKNIPSMIHKTTKKKLKPIKSITMFQFWDFIDPLNKVERNHREILWDKINTPVLVFQNGGFPAITNFGSLNSEVISAGRKSLKTIHKKRCFEEVILGSYQLFGVIVLHGTVPGKEGGLHYTSYIKRDEDWYHYDDIGPSYEKLSGLPLNVFQEKRGIKPEMYFYQRIN
jgi:hypothetical protein